MRDSAETATPGAQPAGNETTVRTGTSPFSYECRGCGRCCFNKRIPLGPYEVLRLARHASLATGEFLRRYVDHEGPWLASRPDGSCVFLVGGCCTVHTDRPFACRVYPLGRWVSARGEETFRELRPHPQSEGRYGQEGTVAGFLERQGAAPYLAAADRLQALFYRLFDAVQGVLPQRPDLPVAVPEAWRTRAVDGDPAFVEWLDADGIVARYCHAQGRPVPETIDAVHDTYFEAIDAWLETTGGQAT